MKNKNLFVAAFMVLAIFTVGCKNEKKEDSSVVGTEVSDSTGTAFEGQDGHNSRNSLDWTGEYAGTLPCADCPGIDVTIVLNPDGTFTQTNVYQDKKDGTFDSKGTFTWDPTGSVVALMVENEVALYKVQEGRLLLLDQEGEFITGELADMYILSKKN